MSENNYNHQGDQGHMYFNLNQSLSEFKRRQIDYIFSYLPIKQDLTVHTNGLRNLHEMSKSVFLGVENKKKEYFKCRLLKILPRVLGVKVHK